MAYFLLHAEQGAFHQRLVPVITTTTTNTRQRNRSRKSVFVLDPDVIPGAGTNLLQCTSQSQVEQKALTKYKKAA